MRYVVLTLLLAGCSAPCLAWRQTEAVAAPVPAPAQACAEVALQAPPEPVAAQAVWCPPAAIQAPPATPGRRWALAGPALLLAAGCAFLMLKRNALALVAVLAGVALLCLPGCASKTDLSDLGLGAKWDDGPRLEAGLGVHEARIGSGGVRDGAVAPAAAAAVPAAPAASAGALSNVLLALLVAGLAVGAWFLIRRKRAA